jgi:hypothetical protein
MDPKTHCKNALLKEALKDGAYTRFLHVSTLVQLKPSIVYEAIIRKLKDERRQAG